MKKYIDCYVDIEAESAEEAESKAIQMDGGEFTNCETGDWRITDAYELSSKGRCYGKYND